MLATARRRFAHGLFAALDLAQDRARGTEILADWEPKDFMPCLVSGSAWPPAPVTRLLRGRGDRA
ncbi:MAG: hypothetical protein IT196_17435 [Acidimicrobiales bacterium]|nr:hypothetical protein [Acidimicrobiales bacterium]